MKLNQKTKFLILLVVNLLVVTPTLILYYVAEPDNPNVTGNENLVSVFNRMVTPAVFVVLIDVFYILRYTKQQSRQAQPKHIQTTGWRRYVQSGLFWFNLLALLPCIIILSLSIFLGGAGLNIGYALIFIFLLPVALVTLALDIYYLLKKS